MKQKMLLFSFAIISVTSLSESIYRLPPITYPTKEQMYERFLNEGRWLMELKGIPEGDETLVCTNWVCPTSIVVNARQYLMVTNLWRGTIEFEVMTTNGKNARLVAFANRAQTSVYLPDYARGVAVHAIGLETNMLFLTYKSFLPDDIPEGDLVYKDIMLKIHAQTNVLDFAAAIINEGLPEAERIPLPPSP